MRVLIIDDDRDAAEVLAVALQKEGHTVRASNDERQAVDLALEFRPDVLLLDIGLPHVSGYDIAATLRAKAEFADLFIIAVTGFGDDADRAQSHDAGFDMHLTKPVDIVILGEVVATVPPPAERLRRLL